MHDRIEALVTEVEAMLDEADCGGLITLERAEIIRYTPDRRAKSRA